MQKALLSKENMRRYNADILIACIGLAAVGIYNGGFPAVCQLAVCLSASLISEVLAFRIILKKNTLSDLSALVCGFIISLLLPAAAPLWVGAVACTVAVFIGKLPFGDSRNAPFVPAAVGFCFVAMLFPEQVFTYSALTDSSAGLFSNQEGFIPGTTVSQMLSTGDSLTINVFSLAALFSGRVPGAIGTTSLLALVGVLCFLVIRQARNIIPSVGFLIAAAAFSLAFPRINGDILTSLIMEISAGSLLFVALMLFTNPVNTPEGGFRALLYGLTAGAVAMLLRYFSKATDPTVFTVMIMNALMPVLFRSSSDKKSRAKKEKKKNKRLKEEQKNEA